MNLCLAPHAPPPQPTCANLRWLQPRGDSRHRVIAWTCDCEDLVYELCAAGGLIFLRSTNLDTPATFETHRMRTSEGWATWQALLSGLAR